MIQLVYMMEYYNLNMFEMYLVSLCSYLILRVFIGCANTIIKLLLFVL